MFKRKDMCDSLKYSSKYIHQANHGQSMDIQSLNNCSDSPFGFGICNTCLQDKPSDIDAWQRNSAVVLSLPFIRGPQGRNAPQFSHCGGSGTPQGCMSL